MISPSSLTVCFGGKTVLLTGAASGIGRALALQLSEAGANVYALDANPMGLESLVSEGAGPGTIVPIVLDVRDREAFVAVVDRVRNEAKSIDFLFNNAGVTQLGETHKVPFERWKWLLDVNLMGVVNGTLAVYPVMIGQGHGHIINTSSLAAATGYASAAAYTASKAAVLEFTRSLRAEAKAYGVRVSVACPGYVDSEIFAQDRIIGADRESVIRDLPTRMMTPAEAAGHLLQGVVKGGNTIVFPFSARQLWRLAHWAPSVIAPFQRRLLRVFGKP